MRKRLVLLGFSVVLATSVLVGLFGNRLMSYPDEPQPWMRVGTYATYSGEILGFSASYNLDATIEVTDLNASFVQVATNSTIGTSFSQQLTDRSVQWIDKANLSFQHIGETLADTYSAEVPVIGNGTRPCTVYHYTNPGGINSTYYLDNTLQWPLRIVYETSFENQTYILEFNLKDTNIKGL
jgi:hypothetical protein